VSTRYDCRSGAPADVRAAALRHAKDAVARGELVVLPTDTVYGVAADAFSAEAVTRLLEAKGRGRAMPPPVLVADVRTLDGLARDVPPAARALAERFWPGALTLVVHAQPTLRWDLGDTRGTVAVRVPDHELARELLAATGPLAVTSANLTGRPAATTAVGAESQLGRSVAVYLDDGPTDTGGSALPSTIVDATAEPLRVVRAGAVSLDRLRDVVPGLLDEHGEAPEVPEPPAPEQDAAEGAPDGDADRPGDPR
jgi:tRNA threonylcarbamoyl adenosine modification protein (Sua5/YciO/YrdC/YwlC family)